MRAIFFLIFFCEVLCNTFTIFAESNGDLDKGVIMLFWKGTIVGDKGVVLRYIISIILVSRLANNFSETTLNNGEDAQN